MIKSCIAFVLGNVLYLFSKRQIDILDVSIIPYIILVITYFCVGFFLCTSSTTTKKELYYLLDFVLVVLLALPIMFPYLAIAQILLNTYSYIFLSLILGYSVKATLLDCMSKESAN